MVREVSGVWRGKCVQRRGCVCVSMCMCVYVPVRRWGVGLWWVARWRGPVDPQGWGDREACQQEGRRTGLVCCVSREVGVASRTTPHRPRPQTLWWLDQVRVCQGRSG